MHATRLATVTATVFLASAAMALPLFNPVFDATYKPDKKSALTKAGCAICHIGHGPKLNTYGADLKKVMADKKTLTADNLKKIEGLDSDKDGVKNDAEIKKGTLPGDPKSK